MRCFKSALLISGLLALPALATPQSLGEVAEKEKERREKQRKGKPVKVLTEEDLYGRKLGGTLSNAGATGATTTTPSPAASPQAGAQSAAQAGKPKEKSEEEVRGEQQQQWNERLQKAREDVTRLTDRANRLQAELNDLTGNLYGATRTRMLNDLEQTRQQLAAAQQALADLEDEGRRNRFM